MKLNLKDKVAVKGFDVVGFFTAESLKGKKSISTEYSGATYYFHTEENKKKFLEDPDNYLPQYGGFCAYGVSQGALVAIVPEAWAIVDGKLYLNVSADVQQLWQEDIPGYISQANQNWPRLISKN